MLMFRSTGVPGYSSFVRDNPRGRSARKCERKVRVEFATDDCVVQSREGKVYARKGDAILTGAHGERWRVSSARFPEKYRPIPPAPPGEDGLYMSRPIEVLALQMQEAFKVQLADGRSILDGASGNWLVDYGDGSLGIVDPAVFADSYQLTD